MTRFIFLDSCHRPIRRLFPDKATLVTNYPGGYAPDRYPVTALVGLEGVEAVARPDFFNWFLCTTRFVQIYLSAGARMILREERKA